jgi:hypothetical protein
MSTPSTRTLWGIQSYPLVFFTFSDCIHSFTDKGSIKNFASDLALFEPLDTSSSTSVLLIIFFILVSKKLAKMSFCMFFIVNFLNTLGYIVEQLNCVLKRMFKHCLWHFCLFFTISFFLYHSCPLLTSIFDCCK